MTRSFLPRLRDALSQTCVHTICPSQPKLSSRGRLILLLLLSTLAYTAITQTAHSQTSISPSSLEPTARMYWHFLSFQHYLDFLAAKYEASGKDAAGLRNSFQTQLGFSDAEYEPVRASCDRLATKVDQLNSEIKSNPGGISTLLQLRDRDVQMEISNLSNELSPQKKEALDALVVRLFTPRQATRKAGQL